MPALAHVRWRGRRQMRRASAGRHRDKELPGGEPPVAILVELLECRVQLEGELRTALSEQATLLGGALHLLVDAQLV